MIHLVELGRKQELLEFGTLSAVQLGSLHFCSAGGDIYRGSGVFLNRGVDMVVLASRYCNNYVVLKV